MFATIPDELLLLIRSYLLVFSFIEGSVKDIETFVREESERSWRSFLAASNNQYWRTIRKETRIWSLKEKSFRKYLKDDWFRQYINERMTNPAQQLHCSFFIGAKEPQLNALVAEMVRESNVGCINTSGYCLTEFPSSQSLQTLSLAWSSSVERLGDFPNLESLQIWECPKLTAVGKMDKLKELHLTLKEITECVVSQFPLEQLEKLVIYGAIVKDFPKFSHRLKSLKDLNLSFSPFSDEFGSFIAQEHPFLNSLIKLRLQHFKLVDLFGLMNLRHLSIVGTPTQPISGKDKIYPKLKTFLWATLSNDRENLDFFRSELTNVSDFTFASRSTVEMKPIILHDRINSLSLYLKEIANIDCSPNRSFLKIMLYGCSLPDYSMFSNVQILLLKECFSLSDLTPFRNVPHLDLELLVRVKDFSCLGNQKYLKISKCDGLTDEAVSHFGNIFHLCVIDCKITVVNGLTHNRYIALESNDSLKEIHLPGKDYLCVIVRYCWVPVVVHLTGRVYSLETAENKRCSVKGLDGKCSYLNGEEVDNIQITQSIKDILIF
jgi:hypothetical protein